jgi:hypothetical protein
MRINNNNSHSRYRKNILNVYVPRPEMVLEIALEVRIAASDYHTNNISRIEDEQKNNRDIMISRAKT